MEEVSVIGIDLAKNVFELCAQTVTGKIVWRKRLKRKAFIGFMEKKAPRCLSGVRGLRRGARLGPLSAGA
jgi:hypothetical protein